VAGGICLLLAFFAFQVLPVSYAGVLLILFGLALLVLEVKVTSFGLLAVGGIISLFLGSMMLIDSPLPELQIGLRLIIPITLGISCVLLFLVRLAVQSQQSRPVTGAAGMLDETGYAIRPVDAIAGQVQVHGEIWTATADQPIAAGERVRVVAVHGLRLHVAPAAAQRSVGGQDPGYSRPPYGGPRTADS
jgi:membrane-bound serine protease (ClpP class)